MTVLAPEQLARLLDRYGAALVLYARQWCRTPEDVVQEAFVRLAGQSPAPENPLAWLYRAVRNGAISAGRKARCRSLHEAAAAHRGEPWFETGDGDALDARQVTQALESLPPAERETIIARLWGGLSFEEIGLLLGASTATAHRWYQNGLARLRERFSASCPQANPARK